MFTHTSRELIHLHGTDLNPANLCRIRICFAFDKIN